MLNRVFLKGNIGRDPKICLTQEGKEIVTFSLATTHSWKDKMGEWQSATDWHHITVFRESTIRWIKDVLRRGDPVYVEGKLSYHHWIDKYGQKRFTPHVVIAGRDGRVECLRSSTSNNNVSLPSNLNSNADLNVQEKLQPKSASSEVVCISEPEDESTDIPLEIVQEENQPISY